MTDIERDSHDDYLLDRQIELEEQNNEFIQD